MIKKQTALQLFLCASVLLLPSISGATDWKKQFAGLDVVALSCLDHSDGGYGKALCESYFTAFEGALEGSSVPVTILGSYRPDGTEPAVPQSLGKALNVRLFVRGTAGNQIAVQLRARASITYSAAVEQGGDTNPRSGELVIWENSVTGSGPSKPLRKAIAQAIVSRSETLIENLKLSWGGE